MTSSLFWPSLLSLPLLYVSFVALLALLWKRKLWAAGFIFGVCWMTSHALYYQSWLVTIQQKTANFSIIGEVLAVDNNQYWQKVTVELHRLDAKTSIALWQPKLTLYHSRSRKDFVELNAGQTIVAEVKLKPAFASINPAGFNYARWLVSKSIIGRGKLISYRLLDEQPSLRESGLEKLVDSLQHFPYSGEMLALMSGDKRLLSQQHKQLYQQAGLGHLFVLSGLHLGIVAFWSWLLAKLLSAIFRAHHQAAPIIFSLLCCLAFCWLANWQLSMMRALLMYGCSMLFILLGNRRKVASGLLLSAFLILLIWPFSLYNNGFWLSYLAVAIVLLCLWLGPKNKLAMLVLIQLAIGLLMMPLQVLLFGLVPSSALLLNLVAVPLFSLVLVPALLLLMLLIGMSSRFAQLLAEFIDSIFSYLYYSLEWLNANLSVSLNSSSVVIGLLLLLPLSAVLIIFNRKRLYLALLLLLLLPSGSRLSQGNAHWQVFVLDVGQGLAVVVSHQGEALIYDTGPRFRSGFSYAESVILPLIAELRTRHVDSIVISHGDNDHAGGREVLEQTFPQAKRYYGRDKRLPDEHCQGSRLWGSLQLDFYLADLGDGNNGSCVLKISDSNTSLLLTGDIELLAEQQLVKAGLTNINIMLSPHHGSNSSSSAGFIDSLRPEVVIHSSGAFNRFGFPHNAVLKRYAASAQYITGRDGAIKLEIDDRSYQVYPYRYLKLSPWYQQIISW
ncbi:DNA internalization-related competence protein ComEC/Rec2 [Agarivorans aestuarii]|uniref:DNA internalization-related competence protein ComEC/Rec2 n=1 Tax=Agarivorans aestuarii TaxID=1563703 RepID=A0ABU7G0V1_9ALTE|nr:DNA internalization-related competence protein ComEC/Rec2 [Agarivorans aestuarii]MEE1673032.1 DNA internalization-related competence protein ComEC/Rec2 [Agarivorans aestuarii]